MSRRAYMVARAIAKNPKTITITREARERYHGGSRPTAPTTHEIECRIGEASEALARLVASIPGAVQTEAGWVMIAPASAPFTAGKTPGQQRETFNAAPLGRFEIVEAQPIMEYAVAVGWVVWLNRIGAVPA